MLKETVIPKGTVVIVAGVDLVLLRDTPVAINEKDWSKLHAPIIEKRDESRIEPRLRLEA